LFKPETHLRFPLTCNASGVALLLSLAAGTACAADGFRLRYPLSGTLGGEIVAPIKPGWFASTVLTQIEIDKVTDGSGNARRDNVAGGFATPQPVAGAMRTATYSGQVNFDAQQSQTQANFMAGYVTENTFRGGRLMAQINVPYAVRLDQKLALSGATPTLSPLSPALSPPLPPGAAAQVQAAAQAGFDAGYQASLAAGSAAGTGVISGFGDAEVTGAWIYQQDKIKLVAGATLSLPTGDYNSASSINVGYGNFYTLRPGVAVAWSPAEDWTLGGRASLGFNSRNRDNDIRSGNFAALDLAAAWRTPIGVIGPHVILVRQTQDDSGGRFGANRFSATGAGLFFTTLIPPLGAALNVSYMRMIEAKNALSGSFFQLRLSKAF
jgi:hypothetical protein